MSLVSGALAVEGAAVKELNTTENRCGRLPFERAKESSSRVRCQPRHGTHFRDPQRGHVRTLGPHGEDVRADQQRHRIKAPFSTNKKNHEKKAGNGDEVSMSCRVTRGHLRVTGVTASAKARGDFLRKVEQRRAAASGFECQFPSGVRPARQTPTARHRRPSLHDIACAQTAAGESAQAQAAPPRLGHAPPAYVRHRRTAVPLRGAT